MNWLEAVAVVWGILTVWLTVRQNIWCWPIGSASNVLFAIIFFNERLYAGMTLQIVYIALNLYGWYKWRYGGADKAPLAVGRTPPRMRWILGGLVLFGAAGAGLALNTFTDTDVGYWDATATVLSLAAQYMLARKWIETWGVWICVNLLHMGLYAYKGLYLTSAQQAVFIALSVAGFLAWRKAMGSSQQPEAQPAA